MLIDWLIKRTIKKSDEINQPAVRSQYTYVASLVGIGTNFILFIIKLIVGTLVGSIAVTADAFNNLSDTASSAITIIGVILANRPADKEHPYGHGRLEYISALIVAASIILFGFQLARSSVERVLNPQPISFDWLSFGLLFISVLLKVGLSRLNKQIGNKINSAALKAAGVDALGDVLISGTVLISFALAPFISYSIDGYVGVGVALFILYMGFKLIKETLSPLLGEAPDPHLVQDITERLLIYPHILGVHDLIIHNYGVGKGMASIHAEFPADLDILEIHDIIDQAEREISEAQNIKLVIHMDPVCAETDEIRQVKSELQTIIDQHPFILSMHDFRIVGKEPKKNLTVDLVVDGYKLTKGIKEAQIIAEVTTKIKAKHPDYHCVIVIDKHFDMERS